MPDPTDMIVPMLQRIQTDVTELKESLKVVNGRLGRIEKKVDSFDSLMTYSLGLNARTRSELDAVKKADRRA